MTSRGALILAVLSFGVWSCASYRSREVGEVAKSSDAEEISARYFFSSLEEDCEVSGSHGAVDRTRSHAHTGDIACSRYEKSSDFLPLPIEGWAHPGTTIAIEEAGDGTVAIRLYLGREATKGSLYDAYKFHPKALEDRVDAAQIPLSGGTSTLDWSMSRETQGLRFVLSDTEKGVFFLVPVKSRFEMRCLLPLAEEAPRGTPGEA